MIRWEKERSAWIAGHATTPSGRRIGELLAKRARQQDRDAAGLGETDAVTAVTPPWFRRGKAAFAGHLVGGLILGAIAVEAYALAWLIYGMWVWAGTKKKFAPRLIVPVLVSVGSLIALRQTGAAASWADWLLRAVPPFVTVVEILLDRLPVTLALTPVVLAVIVWRRGWRAVTGRVRKQQPASARAPRSPRIRSITTAQEPEPTLRWPEHPKTPQFTDEED